MKILFQSNSHSMCAITIKYKQQQSHVNYIIIDNKTELRNESQSSSHNQFPLKSSSRASSRMWKEEEEKNRQNKTHASIVVFCTILFLSLFVF